MNINAGKYKGRKMVLPEGEVTQPTAGIVRQALYTKLQFFVPNKKILDLFAGSGAMGLEGLSRGASAVTLVEKSKDAHLCIQKNMAFLTEEDRKKCRVYHGDALSFLLTVNGPFDLIFLDPPYASDLYEKSLSLIAEKSLLCQDGWIVCECERGKKLPISPEFCISDEKTYGSKKLIYISRKN